MNKLTIMVGLSASGKSTIANKIAKETDAIIISTDSIRGELGDVIDQSNNEEVFKIFHKRIKEGLLNGQNVIADATNISIKSRRALLENVKKIDCIKEAYIIPKPYEKCIEDNIYKEYPVPHHVIIKQMMNFQIPFYEEGFDIITIHNFDDYTDDNFIKSTKDLMSTFNQNNPHHNQLLLAHCVTVFDEMAKYTMNPNILQACVLHDVGKLYTRKTDENGISHYYQHENVGAYYLLSNYMNIIASTYQSTSDMLEMLFYVNYHMLPMNWITDKSKKKAIRTFGENKFNMLTKFNMCDKIRNIKED